MAESIANDKLVELVSMGASMTDRDWQIVLEVKAKHERGMKVTRGEWDLMGVLYVKYCTPKPKPEHELPPMMTGLVAERERLRAQIEHDKEERRKQGKAWPPTWDEYKQEHGLGQYKRKDDGGQETTQATTD